MPRATPGDNWKQGKISLEGYTPAKMTAGTALAGAPTYAAKVSMPGAEGQVRLFTMQGQCTCPSVPLMLHYGFYFVRI